MPYGDDMCSQIMQRLLLLTCLSHLGRGDRSWVYYDCVSPDGTSPPVVCKYPNFKSNYIDVTTADFWCCHSTDSHSNLTTVTCPIMPSNRCYTTAVRVILDADTVVNTYAPPRNDKETETSDSLSFEAKKVIGVVAVFPIAAILVLLGYGCCRSHRKDNDDDISESDDTISFSAVEQPTDDIKLNMGGVTDQAPPYKEATESYVPESYIHGAPFHHIDASLSLAGELSHPPSYEEVTSSGVRSLVLRV